MFFELNIVSNNNDIQHNHPQYIGLICDNHHLWHGIFDTQHNNTLPYYSEYPILFLVFCYAGCLYAGCIYAECRGAVLVIGV